MTSKYDNKNYKSNIAKVKYVLEENEKAALKEIGRFLAKEARQNVEAVTTKRSGILRRNIGYFIRRKTKSVEVGVRKKAFYGVFVEKGHKNIGKGSYFDERSGKVRKPVAFLKLGALKTEFGGSMTKPHPFLMPAIERNIDAVKEIIKKHMGGVTNGTLPASVVTDKVME